MLLLHHTAAAGNNCAGVFVFILFQSAYIAEHSVLRVFTHGAGIEYNKLSLSAPIGKTVAHFA